MRIDGKPVFFRSRAMPSLSDGDRVAVAGVNKAGTLQGLALRNLTTGAVYCPSTLLPLIGSVIVIVIGIPLIPFLGIGLFFVVMGGLILWRCLKVRKAAAMLRDADAQMLTAAP
jgi:hypothetical protein